MTSSTAQDPETRTRTSSGRRIVWLDLLRLLCAIEIVGFHWLRAATKTNTFATHLPENFILSYRQLDIGFIEALHRLLVDDSGSWVHRLTYDLLGIVFGFGWEAVFVFVLLSGFSLALSLGSDEKPSAWFGWTRQRLKRILLPFYFVSGAVATLMFSALTLSGSRTSSAFQAIHQKLISNIGPDISGLVWSQLVLFNPHGHLWQPFFLVPAWWFVPAILLAYIFFPVYMWLLDHLGVAAFLSAGAVVSVLSYSASLRGWLPEFSWNFVIFNECFNFFLGIVLGRYVATQGGRAFLEKTIRSRNSLCAAFAIFVAGNICNLYRITYPISSILFTASLAFCGAGLAQFLTSRFSCRRLIKIDPYHLYLIHQPFAFPLIVVAHVLFGSFAALLGFPIYLLAATAATLLFGKVFAKIQPSR